MPGGYLGDWMGPRKVLMRIVLWWSFFTAATGWAWNFVSLLVTQFLFGAGEAGCFPEPDQGLHHVAAGTRESARAGHHVAERALGRRLHSAAGGAGDAVWWDGATPSQLFGCWAWSGRSCSTAGIATTRCENPSSTQAERDLLRQSAKLATGHGDVPWRKLLRSRQVWMLCWQYFCLSYGWYFYITWLPTYLREGRHMEIASTALLGVLPLFFGGIGQSRVGVWRERGWRAGSGDVGSAPHHGDTSASRAPAAFLLLSTTVHDPLLAMLADRHGEFLQRPGDARRVGRGHGRGRQVRRHAFRRHEHVGQYGRRPGSAGHRLHPALERQQLEPHVLRVGGGLPDGYRMLVVAGPGDAAGP